jgi:hypothetical protein
MNYVAEEFARRLQEETGCVLADREHRRVIESKQHQGLRGLAGVAQGGGAGESDREET